MDDEAASTATGPSRVADRGPASVRSARTARSRTASGDAPPPAAWPSPRALAALRRFGAKTAAAAALDAVAAPWRSVEIDGVGAWVSTGASRARGMDCEVRLRDGPDDHVVVLQWQSRSRKLQWAFEAADDGSSLFRPSSLSPPASPLEDDEDDDSSADGGEAPAAPAPPPAADPGRYDVATGPEVWAAADAVAGADRALGPVRERWAVVRGDAAVFLTCRLKRQRRPLLRTRTARFRVAAMDARRFHDVALAKAAATANAAGWALAELRDDPPDDAASHAAFRQLADAAAFGDLEEAVRRVFGDDGAPRFVF